MKRRKILILVLAVLSVFSVLPATGHAQDNIAEAPDIKVIVNGQSITLDDPVLSVKGRTLLPLRALMAYLGVQNDDEHIIWDGKEKSVKIIKDSIKVKLYQGKETAYLNDVPIKLDVPPFIYGKNSRMYIPVRFVAQSLGKNVSWDDATRSVLIDDLNLVTVSTIDELVAAIDSDTRIILKEGVYNLSKAKQEYSEKSAFWEAVFDGNQLVIKGVRNLTLEGEGDTPAEIVVEPRYANVLSFRECSNITIRNIKAGHTPEQGYCAGGVFSFERSNDINILMSEMYGCGIEGLTLVDTNNLIFADSAIYNCNSTIVNLHNSKNINFYRSSFRGNELDYAGIVAVDNCSIVFDDCDFVDNKVDGYFFDVGLSKIDIINSRICNNSCKDFVPPNVVLTPENTEITGNVFVK